MLKQMPDGLGVRNESVTEGYSENREGRMLDPRLPASGMPEINFSGL